MSRILFLFQTATKQVASFDLVPALPIASGCPGDINAGKNREAIEEENTVPIDISNVQHENLTYYPGDPMNDDINAEVDTEVADAEPGNDTEESAVRDQIYHQQERTSPTFFTPGSASSGRAITLITSTSLDPLTVHAALSCEDASEMEICYRFRGGFS